LSAAAGLEESRKCMFIDVLVSASSYDCPRLKTACVWPGMVRGVSLPMTVGAFFILKVGGEFKGLL